MFRTNLVAHQEEHKIIYCITHFGTIGILFCAPLDERLDLFETCTAHKNCGMKLVIRIVHFVGS